MFHENISNLPRIIFLQAGNFFIDHSRVYPKYFEELKKRLYELNPSYNSHNSEILFEETTQSITLRKKLLMIKMNFILQLEQIYFGKT